MNDKPEAQGYEEPEAQSYEQAAAEDRDGVDWPASGTRPVDEWIDDNWAEYYPEASDQPFFPSPSPENQI